MKRVSGTVVVISFAIAEAISLQGGASAGTKSSRPDYPHVEGYFPVGNMDDNSVGLHTVAIWRQKTNTLTKHGYTNPKTGKRAFNSCMDKDVSAQEVCGSHGVCAPFEKTDIVNPVFFCKCDMGWAGVECTIKQKSQTIAWTLSLLFGFVGADEYYLDQYVNLFFKLIGLFLGFTFYMCGMGHVGTITILSYWLFDIVRIGSAAVTTPTAKVAADLPRWAFSVATLLYFAFIAFLMGVSKIYWEVKSKRRKADMENFYCACDEYGTPVDVKLINGLPEKYASFANAYGADWNAVLHKIQNRGY